jgi:hypothetical protein
MIQIVHRPAPKEIPEYESDHEVDPEQQRAYAAQMAEYEMKRNALAANAEAVRLGLDTPPSYAEMTEAKLFPPAPPSTRRSTTNRRSGSDARSRRNKSIKGRNQSISMENRIVEEIDWNVEREACSPDLCATCASDPKAHSVYVRGGFLDENGEEVPIVYTQPSEAEKYWEHTEINDHFVNLIRSIHPRPWAWVFNAEGLALKHTLDPCCRDQDGDGDHEGVLGEPPLDLHHERQYGSPDVDGDAAALPHARPSRTRSRRWRRSTAGNKIFRVYKNDLYSQLPGAGDPLRAKDLRRRPIARSTLRTASRRSSPTSEARSEIHGNCEPLFSAQSSGLQERRSRSGSSAARSWQRAWTAKVVTDTIAQYTGLTFAFDLGPNGSSAMIRIAFDEAEGCYSRLGTDALQNWGGLNNSMNLGWTDAPLNHAFSYGGRSYTTSTSFDQGGYPGQGTTIVHEFGHALGMVHEHQTPFGNPLVWDDAAVYSAFGGPPNNWSRLDIQSNIISVYSGVGMNGSNFDPLSIMKYSFPSGLLLRPSPAVAAEVERFNLALSACDKYWLAVNYPGKVSEEALLSLGAERASAPGLAPPNTYLILAVLLVAVWLVWPKR